MSGLCPFQSVWASQFVSSGVVGRHPRQESDACCVDATVLNNDVKADLKKFSFRKLPSCQAVVWRPQHSVRHDNQNFTNFILIVVNNCNGAVV